MPITSIIEVAPFQYWLFLIAAVANLVLTISGIVGISISLAIRLLAYEAKRRNDSDVQAELEYAASRRPLGKTVGILETQIYLYALLTQMPGLISAIILFKAFSGWLVTKGLEAEHEGQSFKTLARFYTYAIGNLMSLLWSIAIFEVLRWVVLTFESVRCWVWVQ